MWGTRCRREGWELSGGVGCWLSKLNSKQRHLPAKPSTSSPVGQIKDACTHKLLSTHKSTRVALRKKKKKNPAVKGIAAFQKQVFWERRREGGRRRKKKSKIILNTNMWLLEICITIAFLKKIHKGKRRLPPPHQASPPNPWSVWMLTAAVGLQGKLLRTRLSLFLSFFLHKLQKSSQKRQLFPDSLFLCMN